LNTLWYFYVPISNIRNDGAWIYPSHTKASRLFLMYNHFLVHWKSF
jgi:hypothetical protein